MLGDRETDPIVLEAAIVVLTNVTQLPDPASLPSNLAWPIERISQKLFQTAVPVVLAHHKTRVDLVARAFRLFRECVPYATQALVTAKAIPLASVLIITNLKHIDLVFKIVSFLWVCANAGLVAHLKAVEKVLPNVMKVLELYAEEMPIVETCVAFAYLMDHPKKLEQLQLALRNFPDSKILKALCGSGEVEALIRQAFPSV
jgi:hypothetical protein